jgi:alpha-beta hydrolase superfamily lysophospholipase
MLRRVALVFVATLSLTACFPPEWGADMIVRPWRRPVKDKPDLDFEDITFTSGDVTLKGWLFRTEVEPRRGTIVHLHGISDNRESGVWIAERYVPKGYDVFTFDLRAHGQSGGEFVTYGCREKRDVVAALDAVHADRAILFGGSLGAAIALQAAPLDPRIVGVIAYSTFTDLRSIVMDRKPWIATRWDAEQAIAIAERRAHFKADEASPLRAAPQIHVPVLLLHGGRDRETLPRHSQRVFEALTTLKKKLLIVPRADHNDVLAWPEAQQAVDAWIDAIG